VTGAAVSLCVGLAFAAACAPRTGEVSLPLAPPRSFSESGEEPLPERWWTSFDDPALNQLVEQALRSNFDLASAWQRLRQARAIVERERSSLYPDVDVELEASAREPDFDGGDGLRLGLVSEYEVDLWGRIRSRIDAERYRARATLADYQTAALSLSAEVVRTWFQLIEARSQLSLLDEQVDTNAKVLELLETRFGFGQIRAVDILRQRQLLEATREQRIAAQSRARVLEHLLAVLLGRTPQTGVALAAPRELPEPPARPSAGLPAELIRRRPDILRAYNLLRAANRELAAAISNQYPRLTLSASLSTEENDATDLFDQWVRSFTAGLVGPLIDGDERDAEVDRVEALERQRLYEYGQVTLVAFREVENALIQEKKQAERIESLERQVTLAARAYERLRTEYLNGVTDYIDVLTALTDEQRLRRDLVSARLALLEFRVALYRALAGGFEPVDRRDG
jgi:NodT family efflux transporter outer membrane factor (OMF) lipoprotein